MEENGNIIINFRMDAEFLLNEKEANAVMSGDIGEIEKLLSEKRFKILNSGYISECEIANYNLKYGTHFIQNRDIDFDFDGNEYDKEETPATKAPFDDKNCCPEWVECILDGNRCTFIGRNFCGFFKGYAIKGSFYENIMNIEIFGENVEKIKHRLFEEIQRYSDDEGGEISFKLRYSERGVTVFAYFK